MTSLLVSMPTSTPFDSMGTWWIPFVTMSSSARSVAAVALLEPWVTVHVISVRLPEAGAVFGRQPETANPLGALPEVQMWHQQPRRAAVFWLERSTTEGESHPGLPVGDVGKR